MSSPSLNGPAVNNADSILSQMPISESEGTTCHLPLVSTTMATSLKSITIPILCAPTQEAAKRYVLQKHLAGLVRYLDELRHYGAEDRVRDTYVVNEANIERLRTRIQFVQKSIEVLEKQWTAASEDIDRDLLIYMTEDMVAQTTSFRGGHAAKSGSRNDRTGNTDGVVTYNKPPGRPDRPNHGGYSFVDKLIKDGKWTKQQFQSFIGRVHDMAKTELNVNLSYREQSEKTKLKICEQVAKEYPILHHYPDLWPVRDILKLCLTNYVTLWVFSGTPVASAFDGVEMNAIVEVLRDHDQNAIRDEGIWRFHKYSSCTRHPGIILTSTCHLDIMELMTTLTEPHDRGSEFTRIIGPTLRPVSRLPKRDLALDVAPRIKTSMCLHPRTLNPNPTFAYPSAGYYSCLVPPWPCLKQQILTPPSEQSTNYVLEQRRQTLNLIRQALQDKESPSRGFRISIGGYANRSEGAEAIKIPAW
ncbi:hypothetical protein EDD18DRAFT_1114232 [Armillaria luteobubalina]|uniref:Uncharacterized protein n=1 Tax=Armillaria luteobubalina TaxID=153913 RepID=A0AA39UGN9_9AGAR|nr:hypothetical protein EDD18DRAFT_1114232 [Armillaria luteobubalina]